MTAARSPPRSEPANSHDLRPSAIPLSARSAAVSLRLVDRVEPSIGIGLENPGISGEMPLGMLATAIGRVEEHGGRRSGTAKRLIVAHVSPQPPGSALDLGEHRHRGVIAMDPLGS